MVPRFPFMAMLESLAKAFVYGLEIYSLVGLLFSAAFVSLGVQRLDSEAKGTGIAFRLLVFPGAAAFWPLLLHRWIGGAIEPPIERNPQRM